MNHLIIQFQRLTKAFRNKFIIVSAKKIKRKYVKIDNKINRITVYTRAEKVVIAKHEIYVTPCRKRASFFDSMDMFFNSTKKMQK